MHVVMVEPDIMVDKRGRPIFLIPLNSEERDRVFEDRGEEVVGPIQREAVETNGDECGNGGSHVQETFGRRLKKGGLIYPGNDPERIMLNIKWQLQAQEACCGEEKATAAERSVLRHSSLGQVAECEADRIKDWGWRGRAINGFSPDRNSSPHPCLCRRLYGGCHGVRLCGSMLDVSGPPGVGSGTGHPHRNEGEVW